MTQSFEILGANREGRWVVTVDHASPWVPPEIAGGDLGLPPEDMARHIAYDIGAAGLAGHLGRLLNGPVIQSTFSRLVIDPNRGEDDPTLVMQLYDGSIIPANRGVDAAEIARRCDLLHRPYHAAIDTLVSQRAAPVLLSVHSFTPQFQGRALRPWHVGVLYADDTRLAEPLLERLRAEPDLCIGDNEPYTGRLKGDAMDRHGIAKNRPHVLIELRNDLIASAETQAAWAERLAPILDEALVRAQV